MVNILLSRRLDTMALVAGCMCFSLSAWAQDNYDSDYVSHVAMQTDNNRATSKVCADSLSQVAVLNANQLWAGAFACAEANRKYETNYLLILGQIRAITDMSMLEPVTELDEKKMSEIYMTLFYQTGGSGFDEVYQTSEEFRRWYADVEMWQPKLTFQYDPSWQYYRDIDPTDYQNMLECQKQTRLAQLNWHASRMQNSKYRKLEEQIQAIKTANNGLLVEGTEDYDIHMTLLAQQQAIPAKPYPKAPPKACDLIKPFVYKPDPNANYKQIYTGFNAPNDSDTVTFFRSLQELKTSWVATAIDTQQFDELLQKVDFNKQLLVVLSFGKRGSRVSGNVHISKLDFDAKQQGYSIIGLVGMSDKACMDNDKNYTPFAIAVTKKPDFEFEKSAGYFVQNFPDKCAKHTQNK